MKIGNTIIAAAFTVIIGSAVSAQQSGVQQAKQGTEAKLVGLWEFDTSKHVPKATVGNPLIFEGEEPKYHQWLEDESNTRLQGVITTAPARKENRIRCEHGIAPKSGEKFVNRYSIVADIYSPPGSRDSWRSIFQTNKDNSNDADYFIRNDNDHIGVGKLGYSTAAIDESKWTRLVLTIDLTKSVTEAKVFAYINGTPHHKHTTDSPINGRFSLGPALYFFSDSSGNNAPLQIGTLAIYDGVLTPAAVTTLGTAGTPIPTSSR